MFLFFPVRVQFVKMEATADSTMLRVQQDESTGQQQFLFWHHIQAFNKNKFEMKNLFKLDPNTDYITNQHKIQFFPFF